ncbi:MAG TPA: hypothetical protein VJV79_24630 [Polyangiaceae bacterium]|nr:hypothetical protein [Polyangiaceae bacterium]
MKTNIVLLSAFLCLQSLGCSDGTCGAKQVMVDGNCQDYDTYIATAHGAGSGNASSSGAGSGNASSSGASSSGASSGGRSGAASGGEGGEGGESGSAPSKEAAFGDLCVGTTDCGGETNYCATPPTEPFYCTASGCDVTPEICPEGFQCFNLGQFIPGEPFICTKIPPVGNGAFGDACNTNEDCKGETNYCAFSPTEPPYCTVSGCDAAAELCPDQWSCFDVGQFTPGEPFICLKPAPAM